MSGIAQRALDADDTHVPLPNLLWLRSTKLPQWAVCLDPEARYYGWKMYENNGTWVSGSALQLDEVAEAITMNNLREHWPLFQALYDKLIAERAK